MEDSISWVGENNPVMVLAAFSWAFSNKAKLIAEVHVVHSLAAYSANLPMVAMSTEQSSVCC